MVINFPLAVHDSSPSPSCSLLVVFSPSLSREVASPRTRLASLSKERPYQPSMLIFSLIRYTRKWHRARGRERAWRMPGENVAAGVTFQLMCTATAAWEETWPLLSWDVAGARKTRASKKFVVRTCGKYCSIVSADRRCDVVLTTGVLWHVQVSIVRYFIPGYTYYVARGSLVKSTLSARVPNNYSDVEILRTLLLPIAFEPVFGTWNSSRNFCIAVSKHSSLSRKTKSADDVSPKESIQQWALINHLWLTISYIRTTLLLLFPTNFYSYIFSRHE